jgi:hypothetical protein
MVHLTARYAKGQWRRSKGGYAILYTSSATERAGVHDESEGARGIVVGGSSLERRQRLRNKKAYNHSHLTDLGESLWCLSPLAGRSLTPGVVVQSFGWPATMTLTLATDSSFATQEHLTWSRIQGLLALFADRSFNPALFSDITLTTHHPAVSSGSWLRGSAQIFTVKSNDVLCTICTTVFVPPRPLLNVSGIEVLALRLAIVPYGRVSQRPQRQQAPKMLHFVLEAIKPLRRNGA